MSEANIQEAVKQKYGQAAKQVTAGGTACCGGGGELSGCDPITKNLYDEAQKSGLPAEAVAASLGCGNPTALAKLQAGEVVLDLGSGGGIDVLRLLKIRSGCSDLPGPDVELAEIVIGFVVLWLEVQSFLELCFCRRQFSQADEVDGEFAPDDQLVEVAVSCGA